MVAKPLVEVREAWVGLEEQDDTGHFVAPGQGEIFLEPIDDDRISGQEFLARLAGQPPIVVAAWQIEGDEHYRAKAKAGMFRIVAGLLLKRDCFLAEGKAIAPEQVAQLVQALHRIIAAI